AAAVPAHPHRRLAGHGGRRRARVGGLAGAGPDAPRLRAGLARASGAGDALRDARQLGDALRLRGCASCAPTELLAAVLLAGLLPAARLLVRIHDPDRYPGREPGHRAAHSPTP